MQTPKGIVLKEHQPRRVALGKAYLLVIGIDHYDHSITNLNNAVRDALSVRNLLWERYQFKPERTRTLTNAQARLQNILDALREVAQSAEERDTVLIYFSGHGEYDRQLDEGFWLSADAEPGKDSTYLPFSYFIRYVKSIRSLHTVVIADSCYAGTAFTERSRAEEVALEKLEAFPSRWILAAGRNEVVSDGPPGQHSPFAAALLDILKHHPGGALSIGELSALLLRAVANNAEQLPRGEAIHGVGDRGGQFIFRLKAELEVGPVLEPEKLETPQTQLPERSEPVQRQISLRTSADYRIPETFQTLEAFQMALNTYVTGLNIPTALDLLERGLVPAKPAHIEALYLKTQFEQYNQDRAGGMLELEDMGARSSELIAKLLQLIASLERGQLKPEIVLDAVSGTTNLNPDQQRQLAKLDEKIGKLRDRLIRIKGTDVAMEMRLEEEIAELEEMKKRL